MKLKLKVPAHMSKKLMYIHMDSRLFIGRERRGKRERKRRDKRGERREREKELLVSLLSAGSGRSSQDRTVTTQSLLPLSRLQNHHTIHNKYS